MPSTNFINKKTPITAEWLNEVNTAVFQPGGSLNAVTSVNTQTGVVVLDGNNLVTSATDVNPTTINSALDSKVSTTTFANRATDAQLRDKTTHTGNDPASKVTFSDGKTVEQWRAIIEAQLAGAASAPSITTAPAVPTGTLTVGSTLTKGANGTIVNGSGGAPTHLIQWNRVNLSNVSIPIPGYEMSSTTTSTYILTAADLGYYISWSQQEKDPVNGLLSNVMTSVVTAIITGTAPTNSVAPTLSPTGTQVAGTVITCSTGTWANASTYGYLFYDNGVAIGTRSSTATTTLLSSQAGHTITADVLATSSLGVPSAGVTAASNTVTVAGTNTVANTVLPTITRANGEGAGIIYKGFTYPIVAATWTLNGSATTPTTRQWDYYKNGLFYASNTVASFNVDVNYLVNDVFKLVETVVISGQSYSSSLAAATAYTVNAAPATLTAQVNTASSTFTSGASITPYIPVTATGGTLPYTYSVNPALPSTLSLNTSTGSISGTANTVSNASYTISITDSAGSPATVTSNTTIIIQAAQSISTFASLDATIPFSSQGGTVQAQLTPYNGGSGGPYIFDLTTVSDSIGGGLAGSTTINGSTTRFGKVTNGGRTVIRSAIRQSDPGWADSAARRVDVVLNGATGLASGTKFWFAIEQACPASVFNDANCYLVPWDLHGSSDGGWSGKFGRLEGASHAFMFQILRNSSGDYTNYALGPGGITPPARGYWVQADTFHKYVVHSILSATAGQARTRLWIDGFLAVDTTEAIGTASGTYPVYMKSPTCYDGQSGFSGTGWWLDTRSVKMVLDPNSIYTEPDIRSLLT